MHFYELLTYFLIYLGLFLSAVIFSIYAYFKYSYTYWARKGVPYLEPKFPLGNNDCIGEEAISYATESIAWHNELKRKGHKFGGAWSFAKPVLVLTDPDYIKDILLKDFQYFTDRDFYHNAKDDPKNENLFVLHKDKWKNIRQKLTPTFTSAKMKMMFSSVLNCSDPLIELLEVAAHTGDDVDIKENLASFTTDVIGSVAFGVDVESLRNKNSKFRQMGTDLLNPSLFTSIQLTLGRLCGNVAKKIGAKNTPKYITEFFAEVVRNSIEYRKKNNIKRSDFTQLLMELQEATKNDQRPFTFDEVVANLILFYLAGFDTSSITMTMALYELARNPELQEKVRDEIHAIKNKYSGEITYDAVQEMTYLRQVIDETLRLYAPVYTLSRVAAKPYTFHDTNFTLEKGITVIISAMGVGRDSEYFPEPEKFDPERFSAENKASINSFVFLPFGEGPRICIGKRFGLMQSSVGLVRILEKLKISISPSTRMPLTLKKGTFTLQTNETLYLKVQKIK